MNELLPRLDRLLLALWTGALLFMGAVVAPLLFGHLPTRQVAGEMAGVLFGYLDWMSVALGLWFFLRARYCGRRAWPWLLVAAALLANRLLITPMMEQIKALGPVDALPAGSPLLLRFGMLHGVSSLIFWLVASFLLWQVWRSGSVER